MTRLILGIILLGGGHLLPMLVPSIRDRLKAGLGEAGYKGAYGVAALAGLVLMVWGFIAVRWGEGGDALAYNPPPWGRHITMLLVLLGFVALASSHGKGRLRLMLQNPMSIGVALWAAGHLLANGQVADLWFFGTFLVIGVLDIVLSMARGKRPSYEPNGRSDVIAVVVGLVLYGLFLLVVHPHVFGIPVLQ